MGSGWGGVCVLEITHDITMNCFQHQTISTCVKFHYQTDMKYIESQIKNHLS